MSSSVASTTDPSVHSNLPSKKNPDDPAWKYIKHLPFDANSKSDPTKTKCKLCGKIMSGSLSRAKDHLMRKKGNVSGCPKVDEAIINEIKSFVEGEQSKRTKRNEDVARFERHGRFVERNEDDCVEEIEIETESGSVNKKRKLVSSHRGPMDAYTTVNDPKSSQTTLARNNPIKVQEMKDAWKAIAIWSYEAGIAFNAFKYPSFQTAIYAVGKYGRNMPAPSYHHIRVSLLKEVLDETKTFVASFKTHWAKYGCSIMADFWTDMKGRSLINFMVNCERGTVFLHSIDASAHVKDANLIVGMIDEVIKDVGVENIIQFITDNGSNFKLAGRLLEEKYPTLFWSPCAAHCGNLMLSDIGEKIPRIKNILKEARAVVVYIYNHGRVLELMRGFTDKGDLHRSCVTRFASQFYTLESLHRHQHALKQMFVSDAWVKSEFPKTHEGARVASLVVQKQFFWKDVEFACSIMAPLVDVIRLVDTEEKPSMGYIYEVMDRAKEQIHKNIGEDKPDRPGDRNQLRALRQKIWDMIDQRWENQLHRPLHAAAFYLNPALYYKQAPFTLEGNASIQSGLREVFDRLVPDKDDNGKMFIELNYYRDALRSFGAEQAILLREKMRPSEWWASFGSAAPTVQKVAIRILSQTCSASACERNWSVFDHLHSKKRNCLLQKKLNDLVYIQYNKKLERRFNARLCGEDDSDPLILKEVDDNDEWIVPSDEDLHNFVRAGDDLTWDQVREAMGPGPTGPATRTRMRCARNPLDDEEDVPLTADVDPQEAARHEHEEWLRSIE